MTDEPLVEVTLSKCPTRAGFEITLEPNRSRFLLECQVGFQLPRTVLGRMSIDFGLMLAEAPPQIVGRANVEMTGYSNGFKNINVVHRWVRLALVRLRAAGAVLRRDAFALWVGPVNRGSRKRGVPRCSPRGTRRRKRF